MSDAEFKRDLLKFGGIDANNGTLYLRGNMRMLGNGSYMSQLTVKDMVVTGNAVIPGISFDSLTVAGNVVSTDGNFIGNGALMTGVISTPPPEANIDIIGNVTGAYANVDQITAVSGNIGNVRMAGGNVSVSGQVNVRGNTVAGYFIGNGSRLVGVRVLGTQTIDIIGNVTGNNAIVDDITTSTGNVGGVLMENGNVAISGQIHALGNVAGGYLIGNGAFLTGILTKLPRVANVDIRGNVTGNNANVENVDASVGNIGNVRFSGGNVAVSGQVNALGNIAAGYLVGNGALLTDVSLQPIANSDIRGNITGTYADVDRIIAIFGNVGNVTMGNAGMQISGQITALGNVAADYFDGNGALLTGVILGGTQSIDIQGNVIGTYANMGNIRANSGNVGGVGMGNGNVTISGQVNVVGNVTSGYFIGSGAFLTNIGLPSTANSDIRGNVVGTYVRVGDVRAHYGNVGNVTIGNADVSVSDNMIVRGNVSSKHFISNGALLDALNVSGNARVGGQVDVRGNFTGRNFIGNGSLLYGIVAANIPPIANIDILGNVDGNYAHVGQIVAISGNIGDVIMENGNVTAKGQVNVRGNVTAGYFFGDGALLANVRAAGVQNVNIMGNVIGNYVDVGEIVATSGNIGNVILKNGNLTAGGQVNIIGNATAEYLIGNGALLTGIDRPGMFLSAAIKEKTLPPPGNTWSSNIVIKMSTVQQRGIEYSQSTGKFTLEGGVTYRITAQLMWKIDSASTNQKIYVQYNIVNARTKAKVGTAAEALGTDVSGGNTPGTLLDTIFTPTDTDDFILQSGPGSTASADAYIPADVGAFLNIVVLGSGFSTGFPSTSNVDITGNIEGSNITVDSVAVNVVGNIGNIRMSGGNVDVRGQVNISGNVSAGYFFGNGALLTNVAVSGIQTVNIKGNANGTYAKVVNVVAIRGNVGNIEMSGSNVFVRGQVNVLGNVSAVRFIGDAGLVANAKLDAKYSIDVFGNVRSGNNANGRIIIASTGTIAGVRIENGNVTVPGQVNVIGNVTASRFFGNGILLKNVRIDDVQVIDIQGNVDSGAYITVQVAAALVGNIGNVTFTRMANVVATSGDIGNVIMSGGNVDIPGNLNTPANVKALAFIGDGSTVFDVKLSTPVANIDIYGNVTGNYANSANIQATFGNIGNVVLENGNVVANNANIGDIFFSRGNVSVARGRELNASGEIHANVFIGNAILTGTSPMLVTINMYGNALGIYANMDYIHANVVGTIGNVSLQLGTITATAGNIGNVSLQSGNITAPVGNIGNVRMADGDVRVSGQIIAAGNVFTHGSIKGNGTYLVNLIPTNYIYPEHSNTTIMGNLLGTMVNVTSANAVFGNIANIQMRSDTLYASQINTRKDVIATTILPKTNIIAPFGNVGRVRMINGHMHAGNAVVRGNITASRFIAVGNNANLRNVPLTAYSSTYSTNTSDPVAVGYVFKLNQIFINVRNTYSTSTGAYRLRANVPHRITAQFGITGPQPTPEEESSYMYVRVYDDEAVYGSAIIADENNIQPPLGPPTNLVYLPMAAPLLDVIVVPKTTKDYFIKITFMEKPEQSYRTNYLGSFVNVVTLTGSRVFPSRMIPGSK